MRRAELEHDSDRPAVDRVVDESALIEWPTSETGPGRKKNLPATQPHTDVGSFGCVNPTDRDVQAPVATEYLRSLTAQRGGGKEFGERQSRRRDLEVGLEFLCVKTGDGRHVRHRTE